MLIAKQVMIQQVKIYIYKVIFSNRSILISNQNINMGVNKNRFII